jgi:hypothetical protein
MERQERGEPDDALLGATVTGVVPAAASAAAHESPRAPGPRERTRPIRRRGPVDPRARRRLLAAHRHDGSRRRRPVEAQRVARGRPMRRAGGYPDHDDRRKQDAARAEAQAGEDHEPDEQRREARPRERGARAPPRARPDERPGGGVARAARPQQPGATNTATTAR